MRGRQPTAVCFLGKVTVAFAQVCGSVRVWRESFCYQTSALVILSFRTCWLYSAVFGELPSHKPLPFASDRVHTVGIRLPRVWGWSLICLLLCLCVYLRISRISGYHTVTGHAFSLRKQSLCYRKCGVPDKTDTSQRDQYNQHILHSI